MCHHDATGTQNGTTKLPEPQASLYAAISNIIGSGMMKVPPGITLTQVKSFANTLARDISTYEVASHRTTLNSN